MMHDLINDAVSTIKNAERVGKSECTLEPASKLLVEILKVFQSEGFIGEFEVDEAASGGRVNVKLTKHINDCGVIKPRHAVKNHEIHVWERRYLPSRGFGTLVVSTPKGVISHTKALEENVGGRLLAYVY